MLWTGWRGVVRFGEVQLHHIDGDSSTTTFENLAVLCLDCHSDTLTKHGFARARLTPEIVALYNNSWRALVRGQLLPEHPSGPLREYTQEALLEISLACHIW